MAYNRFEPQVHHLCIPHKLLQCGSDSLFTKVSQLLAIFFMQLGGLLSSRMVGYTPLRSGEKLTDCLHYHEEDSCLVRCVNSAISLNTNEHLIRLKITAYDGRRRAGYGLITSLERTDEMKQGIDTVAEMARHTQPLDYRPTLPRLAASFADESGFDDALSKISNEARLHYFNQAADGLESATLKLSGIFSNAATTIAQINTRSAHTQFFRTSDAQATVVMVHEKHKWEVIAEQSAHRAADLDPAALRRDLAFLTAYYHRGNARQIPLGPYAIVFGPAATAALVNVMNWIGFNGGLMKRGYSFDPGQPATFPFKRDFTGIPRKPKRLFDRGVFQRFSGPRMTPMSSEHSPRGTPWATTAWCSGAATDRSPRWMSWRTCRGTGICSTSLFCTTWISSTPPGGSSRPVRGSAPCYWKGTAP